MNVMVLTTDAYGGRGGIAQYNRDLLDAIANHPGVKAIRVFARSAVDTPGSYHKKVRFWADWSRSRLGYSARVLGEALRPEQVDLIVCGHIHLLPLARILKRRHRCPLALIIYGIDVWQPPERASTRRALAAVDAIASISSVTLERMCAWAGMTDLHTHILPNAIELARYRPAPKAVDLVERFDLAGKPVVMTVGRLAASERSKGFDEMLDILPQLRSEWPDVRYLIVGEGDDVPRLRCKVDKIGLAETVIMTGFVPEARKVDYYNLADAYVMPSRGEGFGFVFLEAMACGIPVVASTADGSREAVRDGLLGAMVDPDDPDAILAATRAALSAPKGKIPDGLDYFSYENFRTRCHAMLDLLFAGIRP